MSLGWPELPLEAIAADEPNALAGGPFGSDLVSDDYRDAGVPVIRGSNFAAEGRFIRGPFAYVSAAKAEQLSRSRARPGDVVFTQRGTVGQVALVPEDLGHDRFVISQSQMKLTCDRRRVLPEFVYYWFRSPLVLDYLDRHTIATGVPHTNLGILRKTPIVLPPLREQRVIAEHLLTLDDRIAALRDLERALERLHRALFRAWFVDFEPVGDPAHPTLRGLPDGLFPDDLAAPAGDPDGAPLPRGWARGGLLDRAEFRNGTAFRPVDFSEPDVGMPVIKIAELSRGVGPQTRWSVTGGRRERRLEDGDVLFAWSGNPQTSIGTTLWGGGPAWLNQHIYQVLPDAPSDRAYLYGLLRRLQPDFVEIARNNQTTGLGHVAKKDLRRLEVLVPPPAVRDAFAELSAPLLDGVVAAKREVLALARARDFLLPHLLRGGLHRRLGDGGAAPPQA
ncbi:MAG: restriction endonuclease subunit S [Myxococcales bacterium]|nr:restriction endonuclease subunit S [Myxococcales bacterium]